MPAASLGLGWNSHRVENIGDLPVAETVISQLFHFFNILKLSFIGDDLAVAILLAVSQAQASRFRSVAPSLAAGDFILVHILHYGGDGGRKIFGNFLQREPLNPVFLVEDVPRKSWLFEGNPYVIYNL